MNQLILAKYERVVKYSCEIVTLPIKVAFETAAHQLVISPLASGTNKFITLSAKLHARPVWN